jgi:hypothetical protein
VALHTAIVMSRFSAPPEVGGYGCTFGNQDALEFIDAGATYAAQQAM